MSESFIINCPEKFQCVNIFIAQLHSAQLQDSAG